MTEFPHVSRFVDPPNVQTVGYVDHVAGYRVTYTRETKKVLRQMYEGGLVEAVHNEGFRLTEVGEELFENLKAGGVMVARSSKSRENKT